MTLADRVSPSRPIAVTGASGRLGSAILGAAAAAGSPAVAWSRPQYDLDDTRSGEALIERDEPSLVIQSAAMTDVDACASDPALAVRRNATAVEELAQACANRNTGLVLISTNEVFDGDRGDGAAYAETDETGPRNPYGQSKLAGEHAAREAFGGWAGLWVVRTAWLYGPPGNDFPAKIVAAADRLDAGDALPVVADEHGSPTYAFDLGRAILELVERTPGGLFHLVNPGSVSRLEWARRVLEVMRPGRAVRPISRTEFSRASDPPPWGALDTALAQRVAGIHMRAWHEALDSYLSTVAEEPSRAP